MLPLARNHAPLVLDGVQIDRVSEVYLPWPIDPGVIRHEADHLLFDLPDTYSNQKCGATARTTIRSWPSPYRCADRCAHAHRQGADQRQPEWRAPEPTRSARSKTPEAFTFTRPGSKPANTSRLKSA